MEQYERNINEAQQRFSEGLKGYCEKMDEHIKSLDYTQEGMQAQADEWRAHPSSRYIAIAILSLIAVSFISAAWAVIQPHMGV